ncbi:hypothetical protein FRB94_014700 [Tulasnella sp. JGI-2019a]|nr:hypothetical protein FRB94_014700 [Tulasnella sp. JGI-2019a]
MGIGSPEWLGVILVPWRIRNPVQLSPEPMWDECATSEQNCRRLRTIGRRMGRCLSRSRRNPERKCASSFYAIGQSGELDRFGDFPKSGFDDLVDGEWPEGKLDSAVLLDKRNVDEIYFSCASCTLLSLLHHRLGHSERLTPIAVVERTWMNKAENFLRANHPTRQRDAPSSLRQCYASISTFSCNYSPYTLHWKPWCDQVVTPQGPLDFLPRIQY